MALEGMNGESEMRRLYAGAIGAALTVILGGCNVFGQESEVVLVREPGARTYSPPKPIAEEAHELWQYAVLSSNVYLEAEQRAAAIAGNRPPETGTPDALAPECRSRQAEYLPLHGWEDWKNFPDPQKKAQWAEELGLNVEVWQTTSRPRTVVIVFEGTNFTSLPDWQANLRWFLRFVPGYEDQYVAVARHVGADFAEELARRAAADGDGWKGLRIVATGHSLGGGLAQHFAYSLPPASKSHGAVPRVSRVYAFDPSPVTGWFSLPSDLRKTNAADLRTDRVFEHGEILAYLRLLQSYVMPPSEKAPAIREIRFNFVRSLNPIRSHSMYQLACDLSHAVNGASPLPAQAGERR
jgi:hypothetical protein